MVVSEEENNSLWFQLDFSNTNIWNKSVVLYLLKDDGIPSAAFNEYTIVFSVKTNCDHDFNGILSAVRSFVKTDSGQQSTLKCLLLWWCQWFALILSFLSEIPFFRWFNTVCDIYCDVSSLNMRTELSVFMIAK